MALTGVVTGFVMYRTPSFWGMPSAKFAYPKFAPNGPVPLVKKMES